MIMTLVASPAHLQRYQSVDHIGTLHYEAATKIQCMARVILARKIWGKLYVRFIKSEIRRIQNEVKEARAQQKRTKKSEILCRQAVRIQALTRGVLVRNRFHMSSVENIGKSFFGSSPFMETVRKRMEIDRNLGTLSAKLSTLSPELNDSEKDQHNAKAARLIHLEAECRRMEIKSKTLEAILKPLLKNLDTLRAEHERLEVEVKGIVNKNDSIRSKNSLSEQDLKQLMMKKKAAKKELEIGFQDAENERTNAEDNLSKLVKSIAVAVQSQSDGFGNRSDVCYAQEAARITRLARRKAKKLEEGMGGPLPSNFSFNLDNSIKSLKKSTAHSADSSDSNEPNNERSNPHQITGNRQSTTEEKSSSRVRKLTGIGDTSMQSISNEKIVSTTYSTNEDPTNREIETTDGTSFSSPTESTFTKMRPSKNHGLIVPTIDDNVNHVHLASRNIRRSKSWHSSKSTSATNHSECTSISGEKLEKEVLEKEMPEDYGRTVRTLTRMNSWDVSNAPSSLESMKMKPSSRHGLIVPIAMVDDNKAGRDSAEAVQLRRTPSSSQKKPLLSRKLSKMKQCSSQGLIQPSVDMENDNDKSELLISKSNSYSIKIKSKSSLSEALANPKPKSRSMIHEKQKPHQKIGDKHDSADKHDSVGKHCAPRRTKSWNPSETYPNSIKVKSKSSMNETLSPCETKPRLRKLKSKALKAEREENRSVQSAHTSNSPSRPIKVKSKSSLSYIKSPNKPKLRRTKSYTKEAEDKAATSHQSGSRSQSQSPTRTRVKKGKNKSEKKLRRSSSASSIRSSKSKSARDDNDVKDNPERGRYRGRRNAEKGLNSRSRSHSLTSTDPNTRPAPRNRKEVSRCHSLTPSKITMSTSSNSRKSKKSMLETIDLPNLDVQVPKNP